ncbi:MAG: Ig-like domain-containing protein, partial [Patescibacteria group bacterium]
MQPDSWYEVTLTTGIKSIPQRGGLPLASNYTWKFQTKNDNSNCRLSCLSVTPVTYTARGLNEQKEYIATPQQDDNACVMLDGGSYTYNWNLKEVAGLQPTLMYSPIPTDKAVRVDANNHSNKDTVRALKETSSNLPLHEIAQTTVGSNTYSGYGEFKIEFNDFYVQEEFPVNQCVTVCTNAEVGAAFSANINSGTINNHINLFRCEEDAGSQGSKCGINVAVSDSVTIAPAIQAGRPNKLLFGLGGSLLQPGTWYEAVIVGGANGVTSIDGKTLVDSSTKQSISEYRWQFKTGLRACEADSVNVYPNPAIATVVGQTIRHNAEAISNSQMCTPNNPQILRGTNYDWQWSSEDNSVANIPVINQISNRNAPAQNVNTVGNGTVVQLNADQCQLSANGFNADKQGQQTKINAGIDAGDPSVEQQLTNASGNNNFCLVCGNTRDEQCKIRNSDGQLIDANLTHGVGANTCCYPRPYVTGATPANDANNVCRNALVTVDFNEPMDIASFNNNIVVAAKYNGACPENWPYLLLADAGQPSQNSWLSRSVNLIATKLTKLPLIGKIFSPFTALATDYGSNWCVVPGSLGGNNFNNKGHATFAPRDLFKAGSGQIGGEHLILI